MWGGGRGWEAGREGGLTLRGTTTGIQREALNKRVQGRVVGSDSDFEMPPPAAGLLGRGRTEGEGKKQCWHFKRYPVSIFD